MSTPTDAPTVIGYHHRLRPGYRFPRGVLHDRTTDRSSPPSRSRAIRSRRRESRNGQDLDDVAGVRQPLRRAPSSALNPPCARQVNRVNVPTVRGRHLAIHRRLCRPGTHGAIRAQKIDGGGGPPRRPTSRIAGFTPSSPTIAISYRLDDPYYLEWLRYLNTARRDRGALHQRRFPQLGCVDLPR